MAETVGLRFSLVLLLICAVCAKKISQGTQTEPPKKIFDFDALNVRDLMRWLATVVVIFIVGLSDKRGEIRNWQTLESLMMFVEGFGFYFFPEELLAYSVSDTMIENECFVPPVKLGQLCACAKLRRKVVGTINKFHICMAQCLGSIEVGFSFTTFLLVRNASRDSLVRSSWLLSRVVVSYLLATLNF
ncbi:hypothetical protein CAPTEDRAFT_188583 [Capitella teleta]|uniref:Uncharacterized protein n=1 Tax=Capitella teleta TaxID=283909 RepID=R7V3V6_CAPTE|nr:hypothetical protein CAPTEDRAFT_188583 [Capitella teleta]|eukprot:ELU11036.1 hypothetical protein CAPTEDRAFT_188583 [Capitella teleta]